MSQRWARPLPLALVAVAAGVTAWTEQGSLAAPDWLPLAVLTALVVGVCVASGAAVQPPRRLAAAVAALALLAGWTACSIAWSPTPAGARDEALLVGLYALTLAVPLLTLRSAGQRLVAVGAVLATLAVLGVAAVVDLLASSHPTTFFFAGRLDFPITYVNACSALFALGLWPALVVAARRDGAPIVRITCTALAALFAAYAVAAQSKGTIIGLAAATIVVFAASNMRLRLAVPTLVVAVPVGALAAPLTAAYRSSGDAAAREVGWAMVGAVAGGAALGAAYVAFDRRLHVSRRTSRRIGQALRMLVIAVPVCGVITFFATVRSPSGYAAAKWSAFKHPDAGNTGSSHLTSLGSNRYDFWRVALDEFAAHPLAGSGGRGFYSVYLEHRRSSETPLRAHSLYLDTLSEEGLPGLALLLIALGLPLARLLRLRARPAAVATLGSFVYFVVHAGVDWIWTIPVVGVCAFLLLGIGCSATDAELLPSRRAWLPAVAAAAVAFLVFAPPWLAHLYVRSAATAANAATDLRLAHDLDPLSLEPAWARFERASTPQAQIAALVPAQREEPRNVAVLYQLGLAYGRAGQPAAARAALARAHALDPHEQVIATALREAR